MDECDEARLLNLVLSASALAPCSRSTSWPALKKRKYGTEGTL